MTEIRTTRQPSHFFGPVRCDDVSREELIDAIVRTEEGPPALFFNINAHALNLILGHPQLAEVYNASRITFCDGFGIVLMGRLFGIARLRHRMTPPDFVEDLYASLRARGRTVFLLGELPETVAAYAQGVERRHPGVVSGHAGGFFELGSEDETQVIAAIRASGAHLLMVGMGMPRQERWVVENRERLSCASVLTVGALFAWGTTVRRRGPRWATDHGLEWLFRLAAEPGRVWKRYLIGLPQVVLRLAMYRFRQGART